MTKSEKANELAVFTHCEDHAMSDEGVQAIEVWHCYILGNEKWLFAITEDGVIIEDYYEVTYNIIKDDFRVDHYEKKSSHFYAR